LFNLPSGSLGARQRQPCAPLWLTSFQSSGQGHCLGGLLQRRVWSAGGQIRFAERAERKRLARLIVGPLITRQGLRESQLRFTDLPLLAVTLADQEERGTLRLFGPGAPIQPPGGVEARARLIFSSLRGVDSG